jgi:hypothetical protein
LLHPFSATAVCFALRRPHARAVKQSCGWRRRQLFWLMLLPLLLAGCANDLMREPLSEKPRVGQLPSLKMPEKAIGMESGADERNDDFIFTDGRPVLIATALEDSDPLPPVRVNWMSFVDAPLQDVLQSVIGDARLSLSIVWDNPAAKISRHSVTMTNLSGDLTTVLNRLAENYGFFWRYKDGMLHIAVDRQYITQIPPVADLFESLPIMVKTLGGTDVFLDKSNRMITFRAGSQSFSKIRSYLEMVRKDRSLIVYDTYIWEVVLNDGSKMGIDWGALGISNPATAFTAGPSSALPAASGLFTAGVVNTVGGGTGLALSFAGSRLSIDVLIDFLRTQGNINSLSQPKIQMLSGGKASLKDEIATTYVSRVGSPTISGSALVAGSVETSQVKTGVTLEISGDVSDGTIYSDIALRVSDLMAMASATVNGSTISLPQTSSREVTTHVRAKPGDTILLAGIQYDKLNNNVKTGMGVLRYSTSDVLRSELVIVMKPRIKRFISRSDANQPSAAITPPPFASAPPGPAQSTPVPSVVVQTISSPPRVDRDSLRDSAPFRRAPAPAGGMEIWRMKEDALRQEAAELQRNQTNAPPVQQRSP